MAWELVSGMGLHERNSGRTRTNAGTARPAPTVQARRIPDVPDVPDASAMLDVLQVLSPVHSERLAILRALQEILTPDNE